MTLTEFLLARIAEDKAAAIAARDAPEKCDWGALRSVQPHIAAFTSHFNGPRQMAECEAKRRIVERETERLHEQWRRRRDEHRQTFDEWLRPPYGEILRDLALPYAEHPDYREEWKP